MMQCFKEGMAVISTANRSAGHEQAVLLGPQEM